MSSMGGGGGTFSGIVHYKSYKSFMQHLQSRNNHYFKHSSIYSNYPFLSPKLHLTECFHRIKFAQVCLQMIKGGGGGSTQIWGVATRF